MFYKSITNGPHGKARPTSLAHVTFWMQKAHAHLQRLVPAMVTRWGIRLFTHIAARTVGQEEDLRYQEMRKS